MRGQVGSHGVFCCSACIWMKDDVSSRDRFISHGRLASDNPLQPGKAFQECGVI